MTLLERIHTLSSKFFEKNLMPTEVWLGEQEQQELLNYLIENYSYAAPMMRIIHGNTKIENLTVYKAAAQSCLRVGFTIGEEKTFNSF